MIHQNKINFVPVSDYLGFSISENGLRESINISIKNRIKKGWAKTAMIKNLLNLPAIRQCGWLQSAVTLTMAVIPPVLCYGSEAWIGCSKKILDGLEQSYKQMLYTIFGFGEKTKYSAVLLETGLYKIKHIIARSQISYMSTVVWDLKESVLNRVII